MNRNEFNWKKVQEKVEGVLGEGFLDEINQLIPKNGPALDMYEEENSVTVILELPGLPKEKESVSLLIEGYKLTVDGVVPCPYVNQNMAKSERFFGRFSRKVTLPFNSKLNEIKATYKNGLLTIHVPKDNKKTNEPIPVSFDDME
jgi:HSP20 family protein